MDPALINLEQVEIQNYIKRYQNLTSTQLQIMLREAAEFTDPQEQNLPLQKALVFLLEQSNPAPQVNSDEALAAFLTQQNAGRNTHPRLKKRLIVVAAVLSALLILTAVAYAVQCWYLLQNVQEDSKDFTGNGNKMFTTGWDVSSGYRYRSTATVEVKDASGTVVETISCDSPTKEY